MKKKIITTILLSLSLGMVCITNNHNSYKETKAVVFPTISPDTNAGLGGSVNLVKNSYGDYNTVDTTNPVFDSSWLSGVTRTKTTLNETQTEIYYDNMIEKFITKMENGSGLSSNAKGDYSNFAQTAVNKFDDYETVPYQDYYYHYFSTYQYTVQKYSYELANYNTNLSLYIRNLSGDYIDDLEAMMYEDITNTEFFDKYGTHVILKGIYGGRFEVNFSAASTIFDIWETYYQSLTNEVASSLYNKIGTTNTISFTPIENIGIYSQYVPNKTEIVTYGGTEVTDLTPSTINDNFSTWITSVQSSPKLVGTSSDGLIPLWDLLPSGFDNDTDRATFMSKYNDYVSSHQITTLDYYYPEALKDETGVCSGYEAVRSGEITITDDGIYEQYYDVVDLNDDFQLKFDYMLERGFTKVDIYVEMQMKEVNMGYQIVALYNSEKEDSTYEFGSTTVEYEGTTLGNYYSAVCFLKKKVPVSTFQSSDPDDDRKLVIRYSAEGSGEDNWMNKKVYVQFVYFK